MKTPFDTFEQRFFQAYKSIHNAHAQTIGGWDVPQIPEGKFKVIFGKIDSVLDPRELNQILREVRDGLITSVDAIAEIHNVDQAEAEEIYKKKINNPLRESNIINDDRE